MPTAIRRIISKGERDIYFNHVFTQPGNYKIFAQFRPLKTKLPPEEAIRAEFWVRVKNQTERRGRWRLAS